MSLTKQLVILAGVGLLLGIVIWWEVPGFSSVKPGDGAQGSAPRAAEESPAPVIAMPVGLTSSAAVVQAVGTGDAAKSVTLYPEASGRVTAILFRAGDTVREGDPLMRLDSEDEELAVELAGVRLKDARQQLARYENTAPTGAVSSSEVDQARTAVSAAQIELAQAELALRKRTLEAPFDGVTGIPDVSVGDRVSTDTTIATLDDRSTLLVDFEIPEAFAQGVREGGPITAKTWAMPGEEFDGVVDSVASRIDAQTRTLRARARIDNEDGLLRTGMSFTIRLPLQGEQLPSVPSIAVQWDRRGAYVWRVVDGQAERVEVDVVKREDQWILVQGPLTPEDQVVVEGVQRLNPGRAVDVTVRESLTKTGTGNGA